MITIISGKLGGGKTLTGVWLLVNALRKGRVVATNIDLRVDRIAADFRLREDWLRSRIHPADPSNLDAIPHGDPRGSGHQRRVVCVVDEAADWFASDDIGKDVRKIRNWLRHTDKVGIDVYLIIQDMRLLNKSGRMLAQRNLEVLDFARVKFAWLGCNPFFWTWGFVRVVEVDLNNLCVGSPYWIRKAEYGRYYDTAQLYADIRSIASSAGCAYDRVESGDGREVVQSSSCVRYYVLGQLIAGGIVACAKLILL